jgi:hypothetical protein
VTNEPNKSNETEDRSEAYRKLAEEDMLLDMQAHVLGRRRQLAAAYPEYDRNKRTISTNLMIQLALLELALIAGSAAAYGAHITETWRMSFIAAGALALGFGAAVLMYRRLIDSRANNLESDYRELGERARTLLQQAERLEGQSNIERRMAAG